MFTRMITRPSRNHNIFSSFRYGNYSSSSLSPEPKNTGVVNGVEVPRLSKNERINKIKQNSMVAAAFASLNLEAKSAEIQTPFTDKKISEAKSTDELLSLCNGTGISRRYALKVISILADWSSSGKIQVIEFENDPRFIRLCRILTKANSINRRTVHTVESRNDDLSTILSVTADDEAAKLVASISVGQMVKVMSTLSQKKRRSTLLLRALAFNITRSPVQLDLKESSDLLYSMAILNFPDENLLSKIANDICLVLEKPISKSSVIGSILTSVGFLRYKNPGLLDCLCEWILKNYTICRPQDIFSLCMTLAVVNYSPPNSDKLIEVLSPLLTPSEASKPLVWLEVVWSLVLLNKAKSEHVSSVLEDGYQEQLKEDMLSASAKLKLLNIDGAAKYLLKGYDGPTISKSAEIRKTHAQVTKEKSEMTESVISSLKNLIQSENFLETNINTEMGFSIDAVCLLDRKCNPLSLDHKNSDKEATKIAIVNHCYHDMCRGQTDPTGINVLAINLLEAQGYKVLVIPYTEFKPSDKLIQRVQYLENKLKQIVQI